MRLAKTTIVSNIMVWAPRWHDRVVLVADYRISIHNVITFPQARSLPGEYYISGTDAKTFPLEDMKTNRGGTIAVRAIPLDALELLERIDEEANPDNGQKESVECVFGVHQNKRLPKVHPWRGTRDLRHVQTHLFF